MTRQISVAPLPIFSDRDRFFTIGSCFAEEIRKALTARRLACLPDYGDIRFDESLAAVDTLPRQPHMNYYSTFSLRQEFERAAGLWIQKRDDLARHINPTARLLVTVSAVPLVRTFSWNDVVIVNLRSKAMLLTVAHELCARHPESIYPLTETTPQFPACAAGRER